MKRNLRLQGETGKSRDGIRAMFGSIAPTYDFLNHLLSFSVDRWWRAVAVRRALECLKGAGGSAIPGGPVRILDLATGTGDLALAFARRLGPSAWIAGIDFAGPMLCRARQKADRASLAGRTAFVEADGQSLPFSAGTFDLATIAFGLRNTEDPDAVLHQMARVLRPGGCAVVLEFAEPPDPLFRALFSFYFFRVLPFVGGVVSRSSAYRYLPASVAGFWGMGEIRRRLQAAGLCPMGSWWLSNGIAALHIARQPESAPAPVPPRCEPPPNQEILLHEDRSPE